MYVKAYNVLQSQLDSMPSDYHILRGHNSSRQSACSHNLVFAVLEGYVLVNIWYSYACGCAPA